MATANCSIPNLGARLNLNDETKIPQLGRLQMDQLVMAMACDLTRVGTVQYGRAGANHHFAWLGPEFATDPYIRPGVDETSGIHGLAHAQANKTYENNLMKCYTWYASELAYLWQKLKSIREGGGTMADNTLVIWMNELGNGSTHSTEDVPWILFGRLGGFRPGRLVSVHGAPASTRAHTHLLVSIGQAFGLTQNTFGDADFAGPMAGLT
jgi:hypothetical protein